MNDLESISFVPSIREQIDMEKLLPWSDAKPMPTEHGEQMVSWAHPTDEFWKLWDAKRGALKAAGVRVSKYPKSSDNWRVYYWRPVPKEELARREQAIAASSAADADIAIPCPDGYAYLGYQRAGVAFMANQFAKQNKGTLLADQMGLGKTIQAVGLINYDDSINRVLIVCPATLKFNWCDELRKWLTRRFALGVISGPPSLKLKNGIHSLLSFDDKEWQNGVEKSQNAILLGSCPEVEVRRASYAFSVEIGAAGVSSSTVAAKSHQPINKPFVALVNGNNPTSFTDDFGNCSFAVEDASKIGSSDAASRRDKFSGDGSTRLENKAASAPLVTQSHIRNAELAKEASSRQPGFKGFEAGSNNLVRNVGGEFFHGICLIVNYDVFHNYRDTLGAVNWDFVVLDEAHYLTDRKARRTKSIFGYKPTRKEPVTEAMSPVKAKRKLCMTGTPLVNKPADLFPMLNWLDPERWDNGFEFKRRYCGGEKTSFGWKFTGVSNQEELKRELRSSVMIRRLKSEVLPDLPPKFRRVVELPNSLETREAIRAEFEKYSPLEARLQTLKQNVATYRDTKNKAQYAEAVKALREGASVAFREMARVRHATAVSKIPIVVERIKMILEEDPDHKMVFFAHHLDLINALRKEWPSACVVVGGMESQAKNNEVNRFQNTDEPLFFGGMRAAAEGITLTAASHVVFLEEDWTAAKVTQAEDRCLTGETLVWYLRADIMGLTAIKDIKTGDLVLSHTGNLRRVENIGSHKHYGMFTRIRYMGWSEPITCTHDHKFFVRRNGRNEWIQAHQLLPSDSMAFPKSKDWTELKAVHIKDDWRIYKTAEKPKACYCGKAIYARQLCVDHYRELLTLKDRPKAPAQINPRYVRLPDVIKIDDEWLYLFGWYAAEGFTSLIEGKSKFVSFSAHEKERHILERIAKKLLAIGIKSTIYKSAKSKGIEMRSYSGELAFWFRDWFGRWSNGISLPKEIQDLPPQQASVFLRGYTDGDGYQRGRQVEWTSASETLCYQMCLLAIRAGFIPTMRKLERDGLTSWIGGYTKFGKGNKRNSEQDSDYVYRPIRSVETFNDKIRVYDLTVEKDHSFTTGFASAHNCARIGQLFNVLVEHWVLEQSLDVNIAQTNVNKQQVMDSILDDVERAELAEIVTVPSRRK